MARRKRRRGTIKGLSMLLLSRFAYKEYKRSSRRKKKVGNSSIDISRLPRWHWDGFY